MKITKTIFLIILILGLIHSCIERFYPGSELDFAPALIIDAAISPDEGEQEIIISQSSSSSELRFI
jgi:hypothetical protein